MCFFSIIIPTYNRAHLIESTLRSVLISTYTNFEIIVVDDGSTDNTKEVITLINDERLFYFYKNNEERGAARNYGIKKSNGDYVFFLDSDDTIPKEYLFYAYKNLNSNDSENSINLFHIPQIGYNNKNDIERQNFCGCQVFVKKEIALQYPFIENRACNVGEDWIFILSIHVRFPLQISKKSFNTYLVNEDSTMNKLTGEQILGSLAIIRKNYSSDIILSRNKKIIKNLNFELLSLAALHYAIDKKSKLSIVYLIEAFKFRFSFILSKRSLAVIKQIILN